MDLDGAGFRGLTREECLQLLSQARTGRLGFHAGALPVVLPVAFRADGNSVVVRVQAGTQLDAATSDAVVAFEADDFGPGKDRWSVSATGMATDITDPAELARARALDLDDWGGGGADRFVRVSLDVMSGRRRALAPTAASPSGGGNDIGGTGPAGVAETHAGVVFFVGDRAYKLKKPLDLAFVDFRSREARLAACRREVELNRRIAPDVYLGVADVSGPDGRLCDHLVVMRRMPSDRRLSSLVADGRPVTGQLVRLAELLAAFHQGCPSSRVIDEAASRSAQAGRWEANASEMERFIGEPIDPDVANAVLSLARRYVAGRRPVFDRRIAQGRARDGHGDLLADDIFCLDDGPRVLDCLEFDDRLRFGDVLADVGFLAMDLERLGRPDLAELFLEHYRRAAGDDWPSSLAHHYIAYRAQVRAKVACLRWSQGHSASREVANQLLGLCRDHLRRARVQLVLVGGRPGTGKSTVARGLAAQMGATVLRSDEVRKEQAGLDPLARAPAGLDEGLYDPPVTSATYAELLSRARHLLGLGETVVLDASWRHPRWREQGARLAQETSTDLVALRCVAPLRVALDRIEKRTRSGSDPSDATPEVARALAAGDWTWVTATDLDTTSDPAETVKRALAAIEGAYQGAAA